MVQEFEQLAKRFEEAHNRRAAILTRRVGQGLYEAGVIGERVAALPTEPPAPLSTVLRTWRESHGLSLSELSRRSGLGKGYLSQLERGQIRRPHLANVELLAAALEIPAEYLVNGHLPSTPGVPER